jgi:CheY-like chemotaxis protein
MAKVLVVDDDADLVDLMKTILESGGHEVVSAGNGSECMARIAEGAPEAIVLDVMMDRPGEGFDVARELRGRDETKKIPIIMLTSINQQQPLKFAPDEDWLPVDAFLEKPVKPDALLTALGKALGA